MNNRRQPWKAICLLSLLGLGLLFIGIRIQHKMMLNAALVAAVNQGSAKQVDDLLSQGADANTAVPWFHSVPPSLEQWYWFRSNIADKGNAPKPVLCLAAEKHNRAVVAVLLTHGADVNGRSCHDYTALFYALGDAPLIKDLLQHGANPSAQDVFGDPALPTATPPAARSNILKMGTNK